MGVGQQNIFAFYRSQVGIPHTLTCGWWLVGCRRKWRIGISTASNSTRIDGARNSTIWIAFSAQFKDVLHTLNPWITTSGLSFSKLYKIISYLLEYIKVEVDHPLSLEVVLLSKFHYVFSTCSERIMYLYLNHWYEGKISKWNIFTTEKHEEVAMKFVFYGIAVPFCYATIGMTRCDHCWFECIGKFQNMYGRMLVIIKNIFQKSYSGVGITERMNSSA